MAVGIPLGPYRLVRRLASGGMAEIFLARQEGKDGFARDLVVKRILPHLVADPEFTRMFRDEAKLAALLSHPNVVHVYDFGSEQDVDGEVLWLAMELVRGVDLRALIVRAVEEARATGRPLAIPPHHAAKIVSFVCEALAHAHALRVDGRPVGVVHRDVTPSNVLVSFDGAVKLADFGIAKARTGKTREATEVGVVKGKLAYLSPEQARGEMLDVRSDLFNVGILLFEAVLGEPLFPHTDFRMAKMLSARGEIPDAHRIDRLPPGLARVVRRALAPRREDRYPDALALRADLETFLRGEPEHSDTVEIGRFVRYLFPDALEEDAKGARAAGTVQATSAIKFGTQVLSAGDGTPSTIPPASREPSPDEPPTQPTLASPRLPSHVPLPHSEFDDPTELSEPSISMRAAHAPRAHAPTPAPSGGRSRLALALGAAASTLIGSIGAAVLIAVPAGGAPDAPPAEPPAVPEPIEGVPPVAPRAPAQLRVTSEPAGHALFVDGTERGPTPAVISVEPGPHRIEIRDAAGAVVAEQPVEVGESEMREVVLTLPPTVELATLRIDSAPAGARVRVDGEDVGTTPLVREVLPTRHRVDVELDGYVPAGNEVTLARPGEQATLAFALTPAPRTSTRRGGARSAASGTLTIATNPWSEVYLGSRHLGTTPLAGVRLPVGTHVLTLRTPGRSPQRTTVTIREGEPTRVRLSL